MIGLFCNLSLCFACEQRYTSDGGTHHHIDDEIRKLEQHRESMSVCVCESSCKLLQQLNYITCTSQNMHLVQQQHIAFVPAHHFWYQQPSLPSVCLHVSVCMLCVCVCVVIGVRV